MGGRALVLTVSPPCGEARGLRVTVESVNFTRAHDFDYMEANRSHRIVYDPAPEGHYVATAEFLLMDGSVEFLKTEACFVGIETRCGVD